MKAMYQLISEARIDIVGFQELQSSQLAELVKLAGEEWATYPGDTIDEPSIQSSIGWRTDTWSLVKAETVPIEPAKGVTVQIPIVLLQNTSTDQQLYVANTYNPVPTADTAAGGWRAK